MANVYAIKSGNWSDTTVWNTGALPTSSDDVYCNNFTITIDQNVNVISLRNTAATGITGGGGFTISGDFSIIALQLIKVTGAATLLAYTGSGVANVTSNIINQPEAQGTYISISGNGNFNFVGNIVNFIAANARSAISKSGTGKLTVTGDISALSINNAAVIFVNSGDLEITGNLSIANTTAPPQPSNTVVDMRSLGRCIVTGAITNNSTSSPSSITSGVANVIYMSSGYVKHIGIMENNSRSGFCLQSTSYGSIVLASGPFVCSPTGHVPFSVARMHYIKTIGSYFEFRDETTDGALPPAAPAPATRLVSPDTVVDAPIPSDVRDGVSYALNTFTGTLKVPPTASVAFGVPVDNTTGIALLTGDSWIAAISSSNDPFAERLRNTATVQTTAAQIAAF
jgi:hypothetical protein